MIADTEEIAAWAREEFGKDKIFVLGHSWGSYLGLELAKRHADWLHAYIGVGQLTDGPESERRGWSFALDAARKASNQEAVQELEAIAPYFAPNQSTPLAHLYVQRKWLDFHGSFMAHARAIQPKATANCADNVIRGCTNLARERDFGASPLASRSQP